MLPRSEFVRNYVYMIRNNFKNFSTLSCVLELHNLFIRPL